MLEPIAERRISPRAFLGRHIAAAAAGLLLGVLLIVTPLALLAPVAILPWLGSMGQAWLARKGSRYRLFPDRLEIESGLLGRRIENVELFRVRDLGLRQGFLGRLLNFGDLYLHSTDSSTPDLHVRAIEAPHEFYTELRQLVTGSRAQHRTLIVEEGQPLAEP